jgi:hypothetical protein
VAIAAPYRTAAEITTTLSNVSTPKP